ncbi:MAG: GerMN domain-containing protein [Chloroflexia bacterium]
MVRNVSAFWVGLALAAVLLACEAPAEPTPHAIPTPSPSSLPPVATDLPSPTPRATMTVTVFFNNTRLNPNLIDCARVFPVVREVPASEDRLTAALRALFGGPTPGEAEEGYVSLFSGATQDILIWARVQGDTAYINLKDIRLLIPSASASCGSADFFAEVENTVKAVANVRRVLFAIEGDPTPFYEFTQIGCGPENDDCDRTPFGP